jgi:ribosomal protein S18 acetylase RimI-like enzyme
MPIREWRLEDLPRVRALLSELSASIGHGYHADDEVLRNHFQLMAKQPDVYATFVAEEDDEIVGFVSVVFYRSVLHHTGTALVNELVVAENRRGRGLGEELLSLCVELARQRGCDEIEVGVEKGNQRAIDFYRKNGMDEEYVLLGREFEPPA